MKTIQYAVGCLLAAAMASASATTINMSQTVNPNPDITVTNAAPYFFYHDITTKGYDATTMYVKSATLSIHLMDKATGGNETFSFLIGEGLASAFTGANINNGAQGASYPVDVLAYLTDLGADGKLRVELRAGSGGSYEFADSTLSAEVDMIVTDTDQDPATVPEPVSASLFALGALGAALARRRRA